MAGDVPEHPEQDPQPSPETGARSANDFRSGSISAACGGNTTILPFVRQLKGQSLRRAVEDYHERADGRSAIDYAFHLIIADPTAQVLVLAQATGLDWRPIVLAYAPGGLAEMSLIALSLGIETAFVATHHIIRIGLIVVVAPLVFTRIRRPGGQA